MYILKFIICAIFLILINASDIKEYKINNHTVVALLGIGLILNLTKGNFFDSLYGALIPLVLFPLFALKMLGAGDIKALCAIGSVVGFKLSIVTVLLSIIAGGIIAVGFMVFRHNAAQRSKVFFEYIKMCIYSKKLLPYNSFTDKKSVFRFSFGISGGYLLMVLNYYMGLI